MTVNRVLRKLARKVAWAVVMSTAAYGVETLWEGRKWLLEGFNKLTTAISRAVAALRKAKMLSGQLISPRHNQPLIDVKNVFLIATLVTLDDAPKRTFFPSPAEDDSGRHRISRWFQSATTHGKLLREGQNIERSIPELRQRTPWSDPLTAGGVCHAWTDGSLRQSAGFGWLITLDDTGTGTAVAHGTKTLGNKQTALDAEVGAIEAVVRWHQENHFRGLHERHRTR